MITIQILEDDDNILPTDWCRPLNLYSMSGGRSDDYSFTCCYTGQPENNAKWVNVHQIIGEVWHNKKVSEYHDAIQDCGLRYEFVRGNILLSHQYGNTRRDIRRLYAVYLNDTVSTFPKYKGKTWAHIKRNDENYFNWADANRLIKRESEFA